MNVYSGVLTDTTMAVAHLDRYLKAMCDRDDNHVSPIPWRWEDPVDSVLFDAFYPILIRRHRACTPSNECLVDAYTRYKEDE